MEQTNATEEEVAKTLGTLTAIKRVSASPSMADKVMRSLTGRKRSMVGAVSPGYRYVLAGLFVLMLLNVFSVVEIRTRVQTDQETRNKIIQAFAEEYRMRVTGYQY